VTTEPRFLEVARALPKDHWRAVYTRVSLEAEDPDGRGRRLVTRVRSKLAAAVGLHRNTVPRALEALRVLRLVMCEGSQGERQTTIWLPTLFPEHAAELVFALERLRRLKPRVLGRFCRVLEGRSDDMAAWTDVTPYFSGMQLTSRDLLADDIWGQGMLFPGAATTDPIRAATTDSELPPQIAGAATTDSELPPQIGSAQAQEGSELPPQIKSPLRRRVDGEEGKDSQNMLPKRKERGPKKTLEEWQAAGLLSTGGPSGQHTTSGRTKKKSIAPLNTRDWLPWRFVWPMLQDLFGPDCLVLHRRAEPGSGLMIDFHDESGHPHAPAVIVALSRMRHKGTNKYPSIDGPKAAIWTQIGSIAFMMPPSRTSVSG